MEANEYQQQAARTLIDAPDTTYTTEELRLVWAALELAQATGAVIDYVKKGVFHRHGVDKETLAAGLRHIKYCLPLLQFASESGRFVSLTPEQTMLVWNVLGLAGEPGEVADLIGDAIKHRCSVDREVVIKEIGDVLWYAAALCTKLNIPLSEVMEGNIAKLKRRFPDGWSTERSINRDVSPECPRASPVIPGATEVPDQTICATTQPEQL